MSINGNNIYYEMYGQGKPLFLLHGYAQSSDTWRAHINDYTDQYQVYLVDLPGHGKSDAFTERLSIRTVAEALHNLIKYLQLETIDAIGFSFGGDVLYQLALLAPDLIDSMVTVGSIGSWSIDDHPMVEKSFTYELAKDYSWIKAAHQSKQQVRELFKQFEHYSIRLSNDDLEAIAAKVLIVAGDNDLGVPLEEVIRARKYLSNSDLWILPNVGHGGYEDENKRRFVNATKRFLCEKHTQ